MPLNISLKGWNAEWFYIRNAKPSLSTSIDSLAVPSANWSARPNGEEMTQVVELLQILGQMRNNLNRVGVAINFICRRIQPSKERVHPAYEYAGDEDTAREAPERIISDVAYARLMELFSTNTQLNNVGQQKAYNITNPPPWVSVPFEVLIMSNLDDVKMFS